MTRPFRPVDIGASGRRAIAWFVEEGVVVDATDADAAGHAMGVVIEAARRARKGVDGRLAVWADEALRLFPLVPDHACTLSGVEFGRFDVSAENVGVGYGYVRPVARGHECGGALFDQQKRAARTIGPYAITLAERVRE
jgi:GNAT superfamily N-acetyltransferase